LCRPHSTCDPTARTPTYRVAPGDRYHDTLCRNVSSCRGNEVETRPATPTSDRECSDVPRNCQQYGRVGRTSMLEGGAIVTRYCGSGGVNLGGNGTTRANAGKSCYTIKHGLGVTQDGAYWVYLDNRNAPIQVYCDMSSCGSDVMGWWRSANRSLCGGWTMTMKASSGSACLNAQQNGHFRGTGTFGDATNTQNSCAKSAAYSRASVKDIMLRSLRDGQSGRNVAWRHSRAQTSLYHVLTRCTRLTDGRLIVPGYGRANAVQTRDSMKGLDWRSGRGQTQNGHDFHELCYRNLDAMKWGTLNRDSTCCGGHIIGCRSPHGHGGNAIGVGMDCGSNCPHSYGGHDGLYTRCITAFGFGSGYASMGNSRDRESMNGHWWGHGSDHMQTYQTGVFVRNPDEL